MLFLSLHFSCLGIQSIHGKRVFSLLLPTSAAVLDQIRAAKYCFFCLFLGPNGFLSGEGSVFFGCGFFLCVFVAVARGNSTCSFSYCIDDDLSVDLTRLQVSQGGYPS